MAGFDQLVLRTARLRLRPLAPADAPALYEVFSDPRVMRYWSTPPWTPEFDTKPLFRPLYFALGQANQ